MPARFHDPFLINTIGHAVGALLFGFMVVLLVKDWRHNGVRRTRLSLIAASLALLWNLGSLLVLAFSGRASLALASVVVFSFSVLSLLPAVLFQVVSVGRRRVAVLIGYGLGITAVSLEAATLAASRPGLHQAALLIIAIGFASLTGWSLLLGFRRTGKRFMRDAELTSILCLLLFSLSFLHFGRGHAASTWTAEIVWHHAGIPLALLVLLQDYRFLLLDVFFRFLFNFGLAAIYSLAGLLLLEHFRAALVRPQNRFWLGISLVAICLAFISFAVLRTRLQQWLTLRLFRRRGVAECANRLSAAGAAALTEEELLGSSARILALWIAAERFDLHLSPEDEFEGPAAAAGLPKARTAELPEWVEAIVPLRFSRGDVQRILLGARQGGRRYLSEDLAALQSLASIVAAQMERFRSHELQRLVSHAELRALQSQINPHFLFNALNTLYGTIDRRSQQARRFVLNLAEIFRYCLHTDQTYIRLEEELRIIKAYLEIEELRLGERLQTILSVPEEALGLEIPKLSVQPLIENAVKHGVAAQQGAGVVRLAVEVTAGGWRILVRDTGPGFLVPRESLPSGSGVGLDNVRQRLQLCYGAAGDLNLETNSCGTTVSFIVPVRGVSHSHRTALAAARFL